MIHESLFNWNRSASKKIAYGKDTYTCCGCFIPQTAKATHAVLVGGVIRPMCDGCHRRRGLSILRMLWNWKHRHE